MRQRKIRIGRGRPLRRRPLQACHFPLRQRRIESDADIAAAMTAAGETILIAASVTLQRFPNLPHEIKNRCTQEGVNGHNLAAIPKFTPSNQESLQEVAHPQNAPSASIFSTHPHTHPQHFENSWENPYIRGDCLSTTQSNPNTENTKPQRIIWQENL